MITIILIIVITAIVLFYYRKNMNGLPPGPWNLPIIGYLPFLNTTAPYKNLTKLSEKFGPIYGFYLGSIYTIVLTDVNLIRDTLKREEFTGRAPLFVTHGIMGGKGIISAEGILWKDQRRQTIEWLKNLGMSKYSPNRKILENKIQSGAEIFLNAIKISSTKRSEVDPFDDLNHALGNILNDLVFGISYAKYDPTWEYLQFLQEEGVKYIGVSGVLNFLPFLRFLPQNRKTINFLLSGKSRTHAIYDEIINKAWTIINNTNNDIKNETSSTNTNCILYNFLLEKRKRLDNGDATSELYSKEQLRHLLADLFGAGSDTTLTTLRWLLLYLAKDIVLQTELRNEIALGAPSHGFCMESLDKLVLLKATVAEAQRIRSVVPLGIPHGVSKETNIGNFKIPKNTMVLPLLWAIHMDPKVWDNPDQFNPYRFISSEGFYTVPPQFAPFQTGKRMCLGDELARMLLYIFTAKIIYHYEIKLPLGTELDMEGECGITLVPPKYRLNFKKVA